MCNVLHNYSSTFVIYLYRCKYDREEHNFILRTAALCSFKTVNSTDKAVRTSFAHDNDSWKVL